VKIREMGEMGAKGADGAKGTRPSSLSYAICVHRQVSTQLSLCFSLPRYFSALFCGKDNGLKPIGRAFNSVAT